MSLGRPRRAGRARRIALLLGIWLAIASFLPNTVAASTTWTKNLYVSTGFVYQDPYYTACTAAATMIMLNTVALRGTGGDGFVWKVTTSKGSTTNPRSMVSILGWERDHDTLSGSGDGSDAHGWRNALNYYGWGPDGWKDAARMVYNDRTYSTFYSATHAAVRAIARYGKPVGILAWGGGHAQVMTGYVVTGADPRTSNDFSLDYVYLADPLKSDGYVNKKVSRKTFRDGNLKLRFRWYTQTDSPYDDKYVDPPTIRASVDPVNGPSEWYHKWVLVLPVRADLPQPTPTPTPTPTPSPTDTPKP